MPNIPSQSPDDNSIVYAYDMRTQPEVESPDDTFQWQHQDRADAEPDLWENPPHKSILSDWCSSPGDLHFDFDLDLGLGLFPTPVCNDLAMHSICDPASYTDLLHKPDFQSLAEDFSFDTMSSDHFSSPRDSDCSRVDLSCCGEDFGNVPSLRAHKEVVHRKYHHCEEVGCNASFTEARSSRRHVRTVHSQERTIFCPQTECGFAQTGFSRKDSLLKHYRRKHGAALVGVA